ncbi:winged helix-turn-helix domain-containing protein [Kutzneria viridogrisea]|uniref:DNA-binding transcriptional ArsR family regulator n=1 Tax=Kutzneria viridogrisea TaxID=47990 RepID=A0ABR6BE94_9PSEU|nr:DNA-binding transcriptional ArsR family regulator [Kutzneria viridogrisea]
MPAAEPLRPATRAEAAALASEVRMRIIRLTYERPLTNLELSQRLGRDPATTLHHVRKLVETGFLEELPARRGTRGAREKPYRSTGLSLRLDFGADRVALQEAALGAFLGEVADVGVAGLRQTRLVFQLPEERRAELLDRLHAVLDEYRDLPADPGGSRFAVYLAAYDSD